MQPIISELEVLGVAPFGPANTEIRFFALRLSHPGWPNWQPGQFIMLRPHSFGLEIPWGRPLGICHMTTRHLICFVQVAGPGTRRISQLRQHEKVLVWGPLGNGFEIDADKPTLLLAGGMGIAPFVGYVNRHPQPWNLAMLFGHRQPISCYPVDSIKEHIPVDTLREHEPEDLDNLIYSMQERMRDCADQKGIALACGPLPFLRTAKRIAAEAGCRLQISLENRMACGVGACLGCAQKTTSAWPHNNGLPVQVCQHGPVFWSDQVDI